MEPVEDGRAAVDARIGELRALVEKEVLTMIAWYQRRKRWPRRLHRLSGVLVIALGATIPLLSAYTDTPSVRVAVGVAGAVISVITGLATVYEWQKTWRLFAVAQTDLEVQLLRWEFALRTADAAPDQPTRLARAVAATDHLLEAATLARRSETLEFFAEKSELPKVT